MSGAAGARATASTWQMYRALVGIGLVCGLLIVGVYELTRPVIAANQAEALRGAIFEVLPAARSSAAYAWTGTRFEPVEEGAVEAAGDEVVFVGYDEGGAVVGFAIEGSGMGYADVIRILYGYDPAADAIVGMQVLESRETPGLGDKIEKDPVFLRNFERLDVTLGADAALARPIEAVKPGEKTAAHQIDTITGATISSVAIADILRDSAARWMPRIEARLAEDFDTGARAAR